MVAVFNRNNQYVLISLLFLVVFILIASLYTKITIDRDRENFQTHASIITDDIWALNPAGAETYLQLAVTANHYKFLRVSIPGDSSFLHVTSPPLTGLPRLLHMIKFIGLKKLEQEITHENQTIGTLYGEKYIRVIFPLINILIFLLLLLLASIFIVYLSINRKLLEKQVQERTQNLRESERRFHDLVNLLPEMVLETDLDGIIGYANKEAHNRLYLNSSSGLPINFLSFIVNEDRKKADRYFQNSLKGDPSDLSDFMVCGPNNEVFPALIRSAPIISDHKVAGARMIVIDITDRRRLEEQLHRDQKMKAIGLMAGGVAHDLNNILSAIISYPELMLLELEEDSSMRHPLETIRKSGMDAAEVVADLLTVARGIAAETEIVDPNELIREYLRSPDFRQLLERYPMVHFSTSFDDDLRNISCSPIHVRKCLMNLSINGMEAIQDAGTLSIITKNHEQDSSPQQNKIDLPEGNYSKIIVRDSGSGILPHEMEHIFEPFYTKKEMGRSGTGLGLAVVWNTMRDHGGTVNVFSNKHGTTFELYFPSVGESIAPDLENEELKAFMGKGETILVIDDEMQQREIARQLLTALDYEVSTASSGEEAVLFLKHHTVDLLLLDMVMSPGQNGRLTYEQILRHHPDQKAVIASGFAEDSDVKATLAMGAGAFVPKPYTLEQIGKTIYKILHQ